MSVRERPSARLLPKASTAKPTGDDAAEKTTPKPPSSTHDTPSEATLPEPLTSPTTTAPSDLQISPVSGGDPVPSPTVKPAASGMPVNRTNWSLLDELDARQTELLDQLADLDRRVEALLRECLAGRGEAESLPTPPAVTMPSTVTGESEEPESGLANHYADLASPT